MIVVPMRAWGNAKDHGLRRNHAVPVRRVIVPGAQGKREKVPDAGSVPPRHREPIGRRVQRVETGVSGEERSHAVQCASARRRAIPNRSAQSHRAARKRHPCLSCSFKIPDPACRVGITASSQWTSRSRNDEEFASHNRSRLHGTGSDSLFGRGRATVREQALLRQSGGQVRD